MVNAGDLAGWIERFTGEDGVHTTAIPRLTLIRMSNPTEQIHVLHEPAVCLVAQGTKRVMAGSAVHLYDPAKYLVVTVDLPVIGQVVKADPARPYLCLSVALDPAAIGALMLDAGIPPASSAAAAPGLVLSALTPDLIDAAVRLVRLLESPADARVLAPLAEREILYRLLTGEQGAILRQIARGESRLQQVNRAIGWIKHNYKKPFRVETVAAEANMSASALHEHFKAVTAMSPLQYQKQLRLQEARRLILSQALDAAGAAHAVGYESPSQFSREYSRLFGAPPLRDAARLRASPELIAGV